MNEERIPYHEDDIQEEVDFSKGVRGRFYRPSARVSIPIELTLDQEQMNFIVRKAEKTGASVADLVSEIVAKEVGIVQTIG